MARPYSGTGERRTVCRACRRPALEEPQSHTGKGLLQSASLEHTLTHTSTYTDRQTHTHTHKATHTKTELNNGGEANLTTTTSTKVANFTPALGSHLIPAQSTVRFLRHGGGGGAGEEHRVTMGYLSNQGRLL